MIKKLRFLFLSLIIILLFSPVSLAKNQLGASSQGIAGNTFMGSSSYTGPISGQYLYTVNENGVMTRGPLVSSLITTATDQSKVGVWYIDSPISAENAIDLSNLGKSGSFEEAGVIFIDYNNTQNKGNPLNIPIKTSGSPGSNTNITLNIVVLNGNSGKTINLLVPPEDKGLNLSGSTGDTLEIYGCSADPGDCPLNIVNPGGTGTNNLISTTAGGTVAVYSGQICFDNNKAATASPILAGGATGSEMTVNVSGGVVNFNNSNNQGALGGTNGTIGNFSNALIYCTQGTQKSASGSLGYFGANSNVENCFIAASNVANNQIGSTGYVTPDNSLIIDIDAQNGTHNGAIQNAFDLEHPGYEDQPCFTGEGYTFGNVNYGWGGIWNNIVLYNLANNSDPALSVEAGESISIPGSCSLTIAPPSTTSIVGNINCSRMGTYVDTYFNNNYGTVYSLNMRGSVPYFYNSNDGSSTYQSSNVGLSPNSRLGKSSSAQINTYLNNNVYPWDLTWSFNPQNDEDDITYLVYSNASGSEYNPTDPATDDESNYWEYYDDEDMQVIYGINSSGYILALDMYGVSLFSPVDAAGNATQTVYLLYNGYGLEEGIYTLNASFDNNSPNGAEIEPEANLNFVIGSSNVVSVTILNSEGTAIPTTMPFTVDLSNGRSYQFRQQTTGTSGQPTTPSNVLWRLGTMTADGNTTSDYATIDSSTGLVTFLQPLGNDLIQVFVSADGVQATPIWVGTTGQLSTEAVTGIKPIMDPVYVNSTLNTLYYPINNLVTTPYEQPLDSDNVTFTSSNSSIIVTSQPDGYALLTPSSSYNGQTTVTATYTLNGQTYETSFVVNLNTVPTNVSGVDAEDSLNFYLSNPVTANVNAVFTPATANTYHDPDQNVASQFKYSSNDNTVAIVDAYGNVTPVGVGTCTITTSYQPAVGNPYTTTTAITVEEAPTPVTITLDPTSLNLDLEVNKEGTITATVDPTDSGQSPVWTVGDSAIATVAASDDNPLVANVTAVAVGETTVTCTVGENTATATVTVVEAPVTPTGLTLDKDVIYLAPEDTANGIMTTDLTATLAPADAVGEITWTTSSRDITLSETTGATTAVTSTDVNGSYEVTASVEGADGEVYTDSCLVVVANTEVVIDTTKSSIRAGGGSPGVAPDYFTVNAAVMANPAIEGSSVNGVTGMTMFAWSQANQSDINAKAVTTNNNGVYSQTFPVNDTPRNNYFLDATDIQINVYASTAGDANDMLIWAPTRNYCESSDWNQNVLVTTYSQNNGFNLPSVGQNVMSGTTGQVLGMEGLRVSTPLEGVDVQYSVYVKDNGGWQEQVTEGEYAGTMWENKQIQKVNISLTGDNAAQYDVQYQVHVSNIGWMDWVNEGNDAGDPNGDLQIEAIAVQIVPAGQALPTNQR